MRFFQSLVDNKTLRHGRKKRMLQFWQKNKTGQRWVCCLVKEKRARKPRFWARGGGLSNTEIKWIKSIFIKAKKTGDYTFFSFKYC